ncbi:MAG: hypothetical protein RL300_897 [Pseudomonadota bacterium]|jgi:uncharacterized OsmC-like protein
MTMDITAAGIRKKQAHLRLHPETGDHPAAPAKARWMGGLRVVTSHEETGVQVQTDMTPDLGGTGDQVPAAWLMRAGLAACATTSILRSAALEGIALTNLEVEVNSRSDARGVFDVPDVDGKPVYVGPHYVGLAVKIAAPGVSEDRLRALVQHGLAHSVVTTTLQNATPIDLQITL